MAAHSDPEAFGGCLLVVAVPGKLQVGGDTYLASHPSSSRARQTLLPLSFRRDLSQRGGSLSWLGLVFLAVMKVTARLLIEAIERAEVGGKELVFNNRAWAGARGT